ncbi:type IV pilus modification protein PilV [Halopseudomonas pachastrellae]|nr:type IV pilus modification protein PilV [Halopseudomonas pachastrellae]
MIINNRKTAGFGLLEVLITLLLVTVGLLGMVAMQGRSIAYTTDSLHRTQAAILANELIEIIRATPSSVVEDENASLYFTGTLPAPLPDRSALSSLIANLWTGKLNAGVTKYADFCPALKMPPSVPSFTSVSQTRPATAALAQHLKSAWPGVLLVQSV